MPASQQLLDAILAMDSYHFGADGGLNGKDANGAQMVSNIAIDGWIRGLASNLTANPNSRSLEQSRG